MPDEALREFVLDVLASLVPVILGGGSWFLARRPQEKPVPHLDRVLSAMAWYMLGVISLYPLLKLETPAAIIDRFVLIVGVMALRSFFLSDSD